MKKSAFTLVEVVVAFVVMAIVMTAVLQSIGAFLQTTQRLNLVRETQREVSFALTKIGDTIRNESIDYEAYSSTGKCKTLALGDPQEQICLGNQWRLDFDNTVDDENLFVWKDDQKGPLFSQSVIVKNATFTISPEKNPDSPEAWGNAALQRQPIVDVSLTVASRRDPSIEFVLSTSYSARVYK